MNASTVARQYIGTPYRHQGRIPGVALDCIGTLICAARELGHVPPDFNITGYRRVPDGHSLMRHMRENFTQIPPSDLRAGDYICLAYDEHPHHVAVVGDYYLGGLSIIHANSKTGKVEESRLVFNNYMRLVGAFRKVVL